MCGIAGFIGGRFDHGGQGARAVLGRMTGAIAYRGPDSAGRLARSRECRWRSATGGSPSSTCRRPASSR